jgi:hypothetical protein
MTIIAPFLAFPPVSWWMEVADAETVILDRAEHFEKMTARNRYHIAGANNSILLSIPLVNGRNQHVAIRDVCIHNESRWQVQHWRALESAYKRSPYFDYYEPALKALFDTPFTHLTAFNKASVLWAKQQLKLKFDLQETEVYIKDYPADITDIRKPNAPTRPLPTYYQVFEDRIGFLPDLSILDLLFCEGPMALTILKR